MAVNIAYLSDNLFELGDHSKMEDLKGAKAEDEKLADLEYFVSDMNAAPYPCRNLYFRT